MKDLNDPAMDPKMRVFLQLLFLLTPGADMGNISSGFHFVLMACIPSVKAKILRNFVAAFRAHNNHAVRCVRQQFQIMCICSGEDHSQGSPFSSVRTERFVPIFSTVCGILPYRLPSQRCFYHAAIHTLPLPSGSFQFIVSLFDIPEISGRLCFRSHTPLGPLSTGTLCAERKRFPPVSTLRAEMGGRPLYLPASPSEMRRQDQHGA